jgi:hypothetical protein
VFDPHVAEAQVRYELSKFNNDSRLSCAKGQPRAVPETLMRALTVSEGCGR